VSSPQTLSPASPPVEAAQERSIRSPGAYEPLGVAINYSESRLSGNWDAQIRELQAGSVEGSPRIFSPTDSSDPSSWDC
jgi:hypothetical protein